MELFSSLIHVPLAYAKGHKDPCAKGPVSNWQHPIFLESVDNINYIYFVQRILSVTLDPLILH